MQHKIYFTPGPAQIFYTLQDHMKEAFRQDIMSISHRSATFQKLFSETRENLKTLLGLPSGYDIYFVSSANEIWERIVQNLIEQQSHHFVNGSFAEKFLQFAQDYKKHPTACQVAYGDAFTDMSVPDTAELISITLNETSIGYGFELEKIYNLRKDHPEKLLAIDGVSAFPAVPFDFSQADTAYFSVQKCFGLPAGLGVWIVNPKCYEKASQLEKKGVVTGSYHSLLQLKASGDKNQTPETPNVLSIFLLNQVVKDMLFRTAAQIQNDTTYKASVLYQAIEQSQTLSPFISNKANRSRTVIVAECQGGNKDLLQKLSEKGWIVGKGYGQFKDSHIRIANFPTHSKEQIELLADQLVQF